MPTVMRIGPYRFFFYSGDWQEPRHIHVERDDSKAKFWLDPVRMERSIGFRAAELKRILFRATPWGGNGGVRVPC